MKICQQKNSVFFSALRRTPSNRHRCVFRECMYRCMFSLRPNVVRTSTRHCTKNIYEPKKQNRHHRLCYQHPTTQNVSIEKHCFSPLDETKQKNENWVLNNKTKQTWTKDIIKRKKKFILRKKGRNSNGAAPPGSRPAGSDPVSHSCVTSVSPLGSRTSYIVVSKGDTVPFFSVIYTIRLIHVCCVACVWVCGIEMRMQRDCYASVQMWLEKKGKTRFERKRSENKEMRFLALSWSGALAVCWWWKLFVTALFIYYWLFKKEWKRPSPDWKIQFKPSLHQTWCLPMPISGLLLICLLTHRPVFLEFGHKLYTTMKMRVFRERAGVTIRAGLNYTARRLLTSELERD